MSSIMGPKAQIALNGVFLPVAGLSTAIAVNDLTKPNQSVGANIANGALAVTGTALAGVTAHGLYKGIKAQRDASTAEASKKIQNPNPRGANVEPPKAQPSFTPHVA